MNGRDERPTTTNASSPAYVPSAFLMARAAGG